MKKLSNILLMAGVAFLATLTITSCNPEVPDTNPLNKKGVNLVAYGPNPVARGGYLRMMGTGLDQIQTVTIAGQEITPIEVVSSEEIKAIVPQDAQIGNLVLTTKGGDTITGRVKITYTEPVGFDAEKPFEPATIKAGQMLTINGEYLNLVTKVILSDGVEVTKFKEQDRKHIVIEKLPAEAQTGSVILSFVATGDTIAQEIPSEAKLDVVLPTVPEIRELTEVKAGEQRKVSGANLDLVTAVLSPTGDSLEYSVSDNGWVLTMTMPEVVMDGTIYIVTASGIKIPVATINVALPKVAKVEPATGLRAGDVITITGNDFGITSTITFATIAGTVAAEPESVSSTQITVKMPETAISGNITINTTANIDVNDEKLVIETLKPALTEFAPAEINMGGVVALNGTDLDLVASVMLTGGAVLTPTDVTATTLNITIPYAGAETGTVTLTMKNGETVTPEAELTIKAPLCAYVIEWPELIDDEPIQAGTLLRIVVGNREKLTGVQIDGQDCGFLFNGENVVFISTPESAGPSSKVKLISEGLGEIEYDYAFKPNTEIVTVLWKGEAVADAWGNQPTFLTDGGAEITAAGVVAGDEIVFYLQRIRPEEGFNFDIQEGHWGAKYAMLCDLNAEDPEREKYDLEGNGGMVKFTVTEEMLTTWTTPQYWGGVFLINGNNIICSKIANVHHVSLEKTIFQGPFVAEDWGNQPNVGTDGGAEFIEFGVHAGQTLYFYIEPASDAWALEIIEGHWGPTYGSFCDVSKAGTEGYESRTGVTGNKIALTVTQEMIDAALTQQWWGGIFVLNGDDVTVTKVTVE